MCGTMFKSIIFLAAIAYSSLNVIAEPDPSEDNFRNIPKNREDDKCYDNAGRPQVKKKRIISILLCFPFIQFYYYCPKVTFWYISKDNREIAGSSWSNSRSLCFATWLPCSYGKKREETRRNENLFLDDLILGFGRDVGWRVINKFEVA